MKLSFFFEYYSITFIYKLTLFSKRRHKYGFIILGNEGKFPVLECSNFNPDVNICFEHAQTGIDVTFNTSYYYIQYIFLQKVLKITKNFRRLAMEKIGKTRINDKNPTWENPQRQYPRRQKPQITEFRQKTHILILIEI